MSGLNAQHPAMPPFARDPFLRLLKFLISVGFWILRSMVQEFARVCGFKRPGYAVGIYYHQVLPEHRSSFGRDKWIIWSVGPFRLVRITLSPCLRDGM